MTNGSLTKGQLYQKESFENVNCKMVVILCQSRCVDKSYGAETKIFQVNTKPADDLISCISRPSAAMELIKYKNGSLSLHRIISTTYAISVGRT